MQIAVYTTTDFWKSVHRATEKKVARNAKCTLSRAQLRRTENLDLCDIQGVSAANVSGLAEVLPGSQGRQETKLEDART